MCNNCPCPGKTRMPLSPELLKEAGIGSSTFVDNEDGTYTHIGSDGVPTTTSLPYVDCAGEPLAADAKVRQVSDGGVGHVTEDLSDCIGNDCAPDLPACPAEGDVTFKDGITWQISGGAWVPVAVTSWSNRAVWRADEVTRDIGDADIAAIHAAGGFVTQDFIERTLTNDDCVPWSGSVFIRAHVNQQAQNDNQWTTILNTTAQGGLTLGTGVPNTVIETGGFNPLPDQQSYKINDMLEVMWYFEDLQPGQSISIMAELQTQAVFYNSSPSNAIRYAGFTGRVEYERDVSCAKGN